MPRLLHLCFLWVPARCLLPEFVPVAQVIRLQTHYNKHHKSSLLDAMELEYGFRGRCDNNSETQAARFQQLVTYYAHQDYYDHTLRDASVLTIRDPKVSQCATVLDTGATCYSYVRYYWCISPFRSTRSGCRSTWFTFDCGFPHLSRSPFGR